VLSRLTVTAANTVSSSALALKMWSHHRAPGDAFPRPHHRRSLTSVQTRIWYGLLFHSSFIGRASAKNKGRISRFLANKCSIASRIDCFADVPVAAFGDHLRQQVEDRLKYFETGEVPKKNVDVMKEATVEAEVEQQKVVKKRKKAAKKAKKAAGEDAEEQPAKPEKGSPKKRKADEEEEEEEPMETEASPKKKKKKSKK